jgi:tetratricopeptide (TPR) repeat protein
MSKRKGSPASPEYLIKRGDKAKSKGDMEQARRYYVAALQIEPTSASAQCRLAALEWVQGNPEGAKQMFQAVVDSDAPSEWRANALIMLGNVHLEQETLEEARQYYARVLHMEIAETYPGERHWMLAHAYCGMGSVEGRRGNVAGAYQLYTQALRHAPNHVASLANISSCYAEMGRMNDAVRALGSALQLEPDRGDLWYDLANIYRDAGRPDLARSCYERAVQLGESKAREELERMQDRSD